MNVAKYVHRSVPVVGNLFEMRRDMVGFFLRVARDYGDLAWSRQGLVDVLVVSSPSAAHEILVEKADAFTKSYALSVFARPLLGDGLLTSEREEHRADRRRLAPAFAHKRVAAYADVMVARAEACAARMIEHGRVDLSEEMMRMTLEIVGKALFDAEVGGDAEAIAEALTDAMQHLIDSLLSIVPIPPKFPTPRNRRAMRVVGRLDEIVYRIISERRRAGGDDRGDVLSILLAPDDEGRRMSDREVRDQVMTLLLAGHETTANALAWTFGELARNPAVRTRLEEETDAVLGSEGFQRGDGIERLKKLPYALAVLKESMRLHPPAYTVGRLTARAVTIAGETIPKGRIVVINIVGMHRRPDFFEDPERFDPERFLADRDKRITKGAYLPFGDGPRVCIGIQFALMEGQLAIATLAKRLRADLDGAFPGPEPLVTLRPRGGMPMRISAR